MHQRFIEVLGQHHNRATNKAMRDALGYNIYEYNMIKQMLIDQGIVANYRCRGGGVYLVIKD